MIRTGLVVSVAVIATCFAASLFAWRELPPDVQIAVQWGADGAVNRTEGKFKALFFIPMLLSALAVILAVVPGIDPRRKHLEGSRPAYLAAWVGTFIVVGGAHLGLVWAALGGGAMPVGLVLYAVAGLIAVIGNFIAKSRSNWFVGLRTPWSLWSEDAWIAANRFAGWGMVASGLLSIAAGLALGGEASVIVLLAGLAISLGGGTLVSYQVWRRSQA